jgi:hypothetical protein
VGHGCGNASDPAGAYLSVSGSVAPIDTILFDVVGMPPLAPVLFFQGEAGSPAIPFGDGALCTAGTITRLAIEFADSTGHVQHPTGADPAVSVSGATPSGSALTRTYQGWYRTSTPLCGPEVFNLTNGWRLTW